MSMKPFHAVSDALTGAIFAELVQHRPERPAAYGWVFELTGPVPCSPLDAPDGGTTYLGCAVDQEIVAASDFFEVFSIRRSA